MRARIALLAVLLMGGASVMIAAGAIAAYTCTGAVFCDDFNRSALGANWNVRQGSALDDGNRMVLTAVNSYTQVSYDANTNVGDGQLEFLWSPQTISGGWKEFYVNFRFNPATSFSQWHRLELRPDAGDICFDTVNGGPCATFGWAANHFYDVVATHSGGTLRVVVDGAAVLTTSYPPSQPATWLKLDAADDGSGQLVDWITYLPPAPLPPTAPQALSASTGPSRGQISLTWSAPASLGTGSLQYYKIYRNSGPNTPLAILTTTPSTSFSNTGLGDGIIYSYAVSAVTTVGEGALSNTAAASTPALPSAPGTLTGTTGPGRGQITLAWSAPVNSGGVAIQTYRIYRDGAFLASTSGTSYANSGLADGESHAYATTAVNVVGEGPAGNQATVASPALPGVPMNFAAAPGTIPGSVQLSWNQPTSTGGVPLTAYAIYRQASAGPVLIGTTSVTSYGYTTAAADQIASEGRPYATNYFVAATNVVGTGSPSAPSCAEPGLVPLTGPPCSLAPGISQRTVGSPQQSAGGPLATTPSADAQVATLDVGPTGTPGYGRVVLNIAGLPVVVDNIYTPGQSTPPLHVSLIHVAQQALAAPGPYTVTVTVVHRYDAANAACPPAAPCVVRNPIGGLATSGLSRDYLLVSANVQGPGNSSVASGFLAIPVAGQLLAATP